jgi:hypothetical protein
VRILATHARCRCLKEGCCHDALCADPPIHASSRGRRRAEWAVKGISRTCRPSATVEVAGASASPRTGYLGALAIWCSRNEDYPERDIRGEVSKRAWEEMISEMRGRGLELTTAARLLWLVVAAIVVVWIVLVSVGAATS